jgi:hypothetical protein
MAYNIATSVSCSIENVDSVQSVSWRWPFLINTTLTTSDDFDSGNQLWLLDAEAFMGTVSIISLGLALTNPTRGVRNPSTSAGSNASNSAKLAQLMEPWPLSTMVNGTSHLLHLGTWKSWRLPIQAAQLCVRCLRTTRCQHLSTTLHRCSGSDSSWPCLEARVNSRPL